MKCLDLPRHSLCANPCLSSRLSTGRGAPWPSSLPPPLQVMLTPEQVYAVPGDTQTHPPSSLGAGGSREPGDQWGPCLDELSAHDKCLPPLPPSFPRTAQAQQVLHQGGIKPPEICFSSYPPSHLLRVGHLAAHTAPCDRHGLDGDTNLPLQGHLKLLASHLFCWWVSLNIYH